VRRRRTFGAWRTIEFWKRASLTTPFNVTGGPALAQCIGFAGNGLPLSMQVVGRPFEDATVLRVAHAYEKATPWRTRRPQLAPDAEFSTVLPPVPDPEPAQIDPATRDRVAVNCRAAGLTLSDRQFDMACAAAAPRHRHDRPALPQPAPTARNPPTSSGSGSKPEKNTVRPFERPIQVRL